MKTYELIIKHKGFMMISSANTNIFNVDSTINTIKQPQGNIDKKTALSLAIGDKVSLDYINKMNKEHSILQKYDVLKDSDTFRFGINDFSLLASNQGYHNFQTYLKDHNLKEDELTSEEVGFYALKANISEFDFDTLGAYQAYKKEKDEKLQTYTEYIQNYKETVGAILRPPTHGASNSMTTISAISYLKDGLAEMMTGLGEARIIFDLNDSNSVEHDEENLRTYQLFSLDVNRDGTLDENDKYFDKLKLVIKDDNGNDKLIKVSSIMSSIDLRQFMDEEKVKKADAFRDDVFKTNDKKSAQAIFENASKNYEYSDRGVGGYFDSKSGRLYTNGVEFRSSNPFTEYIDAKHTYKHLEREDADSYFKEYADKDGWVDLKKSFGTVGIFSKYLNFGYMKKDANGNDYLQKFNYGTYSSSANMDSDKYLSLQSQKFNTLYAEYNKLKQANDIKNADLASKLEGNSFGVDVDSVSSFKSAGMISLEKEFETTTSLSFSLENLEKVKSLVDQGKTSQAFKDMDEVVAMRKNEDGSFTLKFNTGRTLDVDELYYDSGEFLDVNGDKNKRASMVMNDELKGLDTNNDDKLDESEIDFGGYAIEKDGKLQTLKDIGVKAILLYQNPGKVNMELLFNDNNKDNTKQTLYKVTDISNPYKMSIEQLKEYINHPYNTPLEDSSSKIRIYEGRG